MNAPFHGNIDSMEFVHRLRIWPGPPLAWQIVGLLLGGLVVAQLVTLLLTVLLPPAPQPQYNLRDIARSLAGKNTPGNLERVVQSGPPAPRGPGWLTSEGSRRDLAQLIGEDEDDVRLYFYTPLPFAGTVGLPVRGVERDLPQRQAEDQPRPRQRFSLASMQASGFIKTDFPISQAATPAFPGGGFPGGFPGGGFPGGAGGGFPAAGGAVPTTGGARFPGGGFPGGAAPTTAAPTTAPMTRIPGTLSIPPGVTVPLSAGPVVTAPAGTVVSPTLHAPDIGLHFTDGVPGSLSSGGTILVPTLARPPGLPGSTVGNHMAPIPLPAVPVSLPPPIVSPPAHAPLPRPQAVIAPPRLHAEPIPAAPVTVPQTILHGAPAAVPAAPAPQAAKPQPLQQPALPLAPVHRGLFGLAPAPFVEGDFVAALRLANGQWAVVQPVAEPFPNSWQRRVLLWFLISFALVAPLGWLFARRLVRPITGFASAAEQLGRDPTAAILALEGPAEVGRAANAFNRMQSRLRSFVDDRTAMVGAISHDLRTPLTRLRFRIEDVPEEMQAGMLAEVDEMEQMISSVLSFIRDASEPGSRERLDLRSILEDVVEDAVFIGKSVTMEESARAPVDVDPLGMRRLLGNLVENAVKYGDSAQVRLFTDRQDAVAEVHDNGPGLPDEELERVFQPFYRAPAARASNKLGTGLGLAVCRSIARAHGGDVQLMRGARGLIAQVRLPLAYGTADA